MAAMDGIDHHSSADRAVLPFRRVARLGLAVMALLAGGGWLPAQQASADPPASPVELVRAADLNFAQMAYRLTTANVALCDRREPATGIVFHSLSTYAPANRKTVAAGFGFETDIGVEAVVAGSPAADAGVIAGDSLVSVDGASIDTTLPLRRRRATTTQIAALHAALANLPPDAPMVLTLRRGGQDRRVTLTPLPACLSRFELLLASNAAVSDGTLVQVGTVIVDQLGDDSVGIIAHELAHNILRHRARMDAQGIGNGRGPGGRNLPYYLRTETEADILSVYLVTNAGFDAARAIRAWRTLGMAAPDERRDGTHPRWQDRVATMAQALAAIRATPGSFHVPPLLATRDQPLSKNWPAILVRGAP